MKRTPRTPREAKQQLYQTARWRGIRAQQLAEFPLCEICEGVELVTAATVCDHKEPHRGDEVKFWNGPFQSLCSNCHSSLKQQSENGRNPVVKVGLDGWPEFLHD